MKKILIITLTAVIAMCALTSCASTSDSSESMPALSERADAAIGINGVRKPAWADGLDVSDDNYFRVAGSARYSDRRISEKAAKMDATRKMTIRIQEAADSLIQQQITNNGKNLTVSVSAGFLRGAQKCDQWIAEDGTVHVLMQISYENIARGIAESLDEARLSRR